MSSVLCFSAELKESPWWKILVDTRGSSFVLNTAGLVQQQDGWQYIRTYQQLTVNQQVYIPGAVLRDVIGRRPSILENLRNCALSLAHSLREVSRNPGLLNSIKLF